MRSRWTGRLFQSRFASVAMDEDHLIAAVPTSASIRSERGPVRNKKGTFALTANHPGAMSAARADIRAA